MTQYRRFRPTSRGVKNNAVIISPIEFGEDHLKMRPLVVSIPRACGNAIKRNRLKRVLKNSLKTYLGSLPEGKGLWIRLLRQHKIQTPVSQAVWKDTLAAANILV